MWCDNPRFISGDFVYKTPAVSPGILCWKISRPGPGVSFKKRGENSIPAKGTMGNLANLVGEGKLCISFLRRNSL